MDARPERLAGEVSILRRAELEDRYGRGSHNPESAQRSDRPEYDGCPHDRIHLLARLSVLSHVERGPMRVVTALMAGFGLAVSASSVLAQAAPTGPATAPSRAQAAEAPKPPEFEYLGTLRVE